MAFIEPLNLYYWLVTTFSGNLTIFLALAFLVIAALSAMFRMPNIITFVGVGLFIIMLSTFVGNILILFLVVAGIVIFWQLAKMFAK